MKEPSISVPYLRPRRLRDNAILREAIAETAVRPEHLMLPMFVSDIKTDNPIASMPGVSQRSIPSLVREIGSLVERGLRSFILFGVPKTKDALASAAYAEDAIVARAIEAIRRDIGDAAFVATDVCLCSYTDTGHCGVIEDGRVANDPSLELLAKTALRHARAGANMVAPSDMMDGRVRAIREELDDHGFEHLPIMSYAIKYASSLYGPFRDAADSTPQFGDRRGYQMDFRNRGEAIREAMLDAEEGADLLMVKPGLAYLDILSDLRELTELPLAAYQVSGEYAMIRFAALAGAIDEAKVTRELWTAFRRAGANIILTYHAADAVRNGWLG